MKHHKKACRSLSFSSDGNHLYTCSKDQSVQCVDMNTGTKLFNVSCAHAEAINSLKVLNEHYLATGSDDGAVKV